MRDAHEFVQHVSRTYYIAVPDLAVIAQSVGAVIAAAWLHDYAPAVRAVVLATPAFRVKLYVPLAIPGLRLLQKIRERAFIRSYVKPGLLTHDREQAAQYASDPLISPQIAVNILLGLYDTSLRVVNDAGAIVAPVQLLVSGVTGWWMIARSFDSSSSCRPMCGNVFCTRSSFIPRSGRKIANNRSRRPVSLF